MPVDADEGLNEARLALSAARAELDEAVAAVPRVDGEATVASPELVALLVRAVKAKNRLDDILSARAPRTPRP